MILLVIIRIGHDKIDVQNGCYILVVVEKDQQVMRMFVGLQEVIELLGKGLFRV